MCTFKEKAMWGQNKNSTICLPWYSPPEKLNSSNTLIPGLPASRTVKNITCPLIYSVTDVLLWWTYQLNTGTLRKTRNTKSKVILHCSSVGLVSVRPWCCYGLARLTLTVRSGWSVEISLFTECQHQTVPHWPWWIKMEINYSGSLLNTEQRSTRHIHLLVNVDYCCFSPLQLG